MEIAKLAPVAAPARLATDTATAPRTPEAGAVQPDGAVSARELTLAVPEPKQARDELADRIEELRAEINANSRSRLSIDREGSKGQFIYRIVDPETGETMRQWPPEKYVELVAYLRDQSGGLLDQHA